MRGVARAPALFALDATPAGIAFDGKGERLAVGLGDGTVRIVPVRGGEPLTAAAPTVAAHDGAVLHLRADGDGFLSGGDDGRLVRIGRDGVAETLLQVPGRWIDALAVAGDALAGGAWAAATGKTVHGLGAPLDHPSTVGALAFDPAGRRLAVAHYGGVTVWPVGGGEPQRLEWKGSHIAVSWSPDGRFVVAAAQDNELHAWRIADSTAMQMAGYGTKTRSLSWGPGGKYLATSGADGVVLWSFAGEGPFGKPPMELGPERKTLVTAVACHPREALIAYGYRDGQVSLIGFDDRPPLDLLPADGEPVAGAAWSADGGWLAAAGESGRVALWRRGGGLMERVKGWLRGA